ncbi:MAG: hypothetical protein GX844_08585 [Alcaligenaceae bacterium]|nr:hypothetical protein [Alcaligenaceae bacterium]
MVRKSMIRLAVAGTLMACLSACTILPKGPELTVYQLPQLPVHAQSAPSNQDVLRVAIPYSSNYLNTQRVAVLTPERSLAVMNGIRWEDLSTVVFRDSLIRAIRSAGIYKSVTNDDTSLGNYVLLSELQDFQVDYTMEPAQVVVSVDVNLVDLESSAKRTSTNSRFFSATAPVQSKSNEAVIDAFADANNQVQQQVIQWLSTLPRVSR